MATPFPGMDPEYLKNLQAMMAAMGPSQSDKDAAKWQGLLAAGLGLMGARKGQELAAVGNAGLLGMDARNRSLVQATAEKGAGLNQALNAQQLQTTMKSQADADQYRAVMKQIAEQDAGAQSVPFGAQGGAPAAASFGPAIAAAAATGGARLSTNKVSDYERAIQYAQKLEANGVAPSYVEAAYAKAEKLRPKVKETRAVVDPQTGQRALANVYEDGRIEIQKGAAPDMEKLHFQDTGGGYAGLNPFTGAPAPGAIGVKTQSADSKASNALGWANYKLAADRASQDKGEQFGTPISITNDSGTSLFAPRKGTNQLVPMVDGSGQPVSKSANIPQAFKEKAYVIANLKDDLKSYNDELQKTKPADMFNPNTAARLKAKYGAVQMGLKGLFELGVIAGPDMEIMAQNLTDPTSGRGLMLMQTGGLGEQHKVLSDKLANSERNLSKAFGQNAGKHDDPLGLR